MRRLARQLLEERASAGGKPGHEEKDRDMIKLNETSNASISLVGEDELSQVVGGYCHRRRRHCGGGWRPREYRGCGYGYGKKDYGYEGEKYETEGYEGDDYQNEYESSGGDVQIANVAVTVNIAQVQG